MATEIRKIYRGKDEIDLDAYLKALQNGIDNYVDSLKGRIYYDQASKKNREIKDEDLFAIKNAINYMYGRLNANDNTFTYRTDTATGGFSDSTGQVRNDVYNGLAARFLGDTLRGMAVYQKPEDPSKVKYSDDAIGFILRNRILGKGTIQDFIDLDKPDPKDSSKRSNLKRSLRFKAELENFVNDLKTGANEVSDWTEEQRNKYIPGLENLFTKFDDGIQSDEYLDLAKNLGISDLRQWFAVDKDAIPTVTDSDGTEVQQGRTNTDKLRWIQRTYGRPYKGPLMDQISFNSTPLKLGDWQMQKLGAAFQSASTQDLVNLILEAITNNDYGTYNFIKNMKLPPSVQYILGTNQTQARDFLVKNAINQLKTRQANNGIGLYNFGDNSNYFYIGNGNYSKRGTGLVYDTNSNSIQEASIYKIPYWLQQIETAWINQGGNEEIDPDLPQIFSGTASYKEGGTIRKFNGGGGVVIGGITHKDNFNWSQYSTSILDSVLAEAKKQLTYELRKKYAAGINDMQSRHSKLYKKWNKKDSYLGTDDDVKNYQADIIKTYGYVNDAIDKIRQDSQYIDPKNPHTGDSKDKSWTPDNYYGAQTDDRRVLFRADDQSVSQQLIDDYTKKFKDAGYKMYLDNSDSYYKLEALPHELSPDKDNTYAPQLIGAPKPDTPEHIAQIVSQAKIASRVDEGDTDPKKPKKGLGALASISSLVPDTIAAARLALSLRSNKEIEKSLQPHLSLSEPLNLFKPILGNEPLKQAYHLKGSEIESAAYRNADADADRNAARQHEGSVAGAEMDLKGDLIDNAAILKSIDDNFTTRKWLAEYNQNVWNENRDRIAKFWNIVGQIKAQRLQNDYAGINEFLGGLETRGRTKLKEMKAYQKQQDELTAYNKYVNELNQINELTSAWRANNSGKSISSTPWWSKILQRQTEISNRIKNDYNMLMAKREGIPFTNDLYANDPYVVTDWTNIIV